MIIKRQQDRVSKPVNHPGSLIQKQVYIENNQIPHTTQIASVILKPHDHISAHTHTNVYECYVILSGTVHAIINNNSIELEPQDFLCVEPQEQHEITNTSAENAMLLYWSIAS
jgi:mannose-6-phosphate isomerase-like protein (cupin superfamily)